MTNETTTTQRQRKRGREKEISIRAPATDEPGGIAAILARTLPEWEHINEADRDKMIALAQVQAAAPDPIEVKLKRHDSGRVEVAPAGKSAALSYLKLQKAFAAPSVEAMNARSSELLLYLQSIGACNDAKFNAAASFMESMEPADQSQAMLLVQAYATHDAAIRALSQLGSSQSVDNAKLFGNLATKLLRTYQGQMDTLMRMQRGNEQVVKHVYVDNRGGQAVIAENVTGGGAASKSGPQPHAAVPIGSGATLFGADPFGGAVPVSGNIGSEAMPDARRSIAGGADGDGER